MFDSHCHLHDARVTDPAGDIARARAAGVETMLLAGVDAEGWRDEARLAAAHAELVVSYGIHPQIVAARDDATCDRELTALAAALDNGVDGVRAVCVGEIGLDGAADRKPSLPRQERIFRAQLALARRFRLPIALHVLHAHPHALAVLREFGPPPDGGVLHSCSASAELVREYLALGWHISFTGAVAYPTAKKTPLAARAVPRERLLVESDAPDQVPVEHKPALNQPAYLPAVLRGLAQARGEDQSQLARVTADNARRLFRL